jgi:hypothetical protein
MYLRVDNNSRLLFLKVRAISAKLRNVIRVRNAYNSSFRQLLG